jgi:alkylated DNA nucleotide flippase Atl1
MSSKSVKQTIGRTWEPTRWWRVLDKTGDLWMESSDEEENRREATREGHKLQRLMQHRTRRKNGWMDVEQTDRDKWETLRIERDQEIADDNRD